jgi:hypothetical protein
LPTSNPTTQDNLSLLKTLVDLSQDLKFQDLQDPQGHQDQQDPLDHNDLLDLQLDHTGLLQSNPKKDQSIMKLVLIKDHTKEVWSESLRLDEENLKICSGKI